MLIKKIYLIIVLVIVLFIILFHIFLYKNTSKYITSTIEPLNNISKYTAIIVEPRKHKALSFVLQNFLENLNNDWNIIIFHGNQNETFIDNIIKNNLNKYINRITKINLNVDNLTIEEYSKLLATPTFYDNIPTETFLVFQTDSIICEENKDLINDFLDYDYVGAPCGWSDDKLTIIHEVGNGGLSLRKKSKMLEIIKNCPYDSCGVQDDTCCKIEDLYFTNACPSIKRNIPSVEIAKKFSVESVYSDKFFGVHKPWAYNNKETMDKLEHRCKSLKKLKELNH